MPDACRAPSSRSLPNSAQPRKPPMNRDNPEHDGRRCHRVLAGHQGAGDEAGDGADDDERDDEPEHGILHCVVTAPHRHIGSPTDSPPRFTPTSHRQPDGGENARAARLRGGRSRGLFFRCSPQQPVPGRRGAVDQPEAPSDSHRSLADQPTSPRPVRSTTRGSVFLDLLRTTDHKVIGKIYLVTSFVFFPGRRVIALLIRCQLARPGTPSSTSSSYNPLFTLHGTIMMCLFATPIVFAFANLVLPLQVGAPDVGLPAPERPLLLAVPLRRAHRVSGFLSPGGRPTSPGLPTHRSPTRSTRRAPAPTCGSSGCRSPVSPPSSARSTSSPRSITLRAPA